MGLTRMARRGGLALVAAVAALALAACGGGSEGASGTGSGGTKNLGSAKIVLGGKVITWAPAYVAVC